MKPFLLIAISLALGALAWLMLWLSDLVLGDTPPKVNHPGCGEHVIGSTVEQRRQQDEPARGRLRRTALDHRRGTISLASRSRRLPRERVRDRVTKPHTCLAQTPVLILS